MIYVGGDVPDAPLSDVPDAPLSDVPENLI